MPIRHRFWFVTTATLLLLLTSLVPTHTPAVLAQGSTVVTNANDSGDGSLRSVIEGIQNGVIDPSQPITFQDDVTLIALGSPIEINSVPVVINGDGVAIQSQGGDEIFDVRANTTLDGVTLRSTSSNRGNGIRHRGGTLIIRNTVFEQLGPDYALRSSAGSVTLTDVALFDVNTAEGAIQIDGSGVIADAVGLDVASNTTSNSARGALTINTSNTTEQRITRSIFKSNDAAAQVSVLAGNLTLINSVISSGVSSGIRVGSSGTAELSFVTIADNGGVGINNQGTLNMANSAVDDNCSNGNAINLEGRNFFGGSGCTFTPESRGFEITNLKLSLDGSLVPMPDTDSPLVNRVDAGQCIEFGGASANFDDFEGSDNRLGISNCDVGAIEISESSITGGEIEVSTRTNVDNIILTEEEVEYRLIRLELNTFPIAAVTFTASVDGTAPLDCELEDAGGNPTPGPVTLTFNDSNWNTGDVALRVRAVDDSDQEGDHQCNLTITFASSTDPLYNSIASELKITNLRIEDNDLVDKPVINLDFSAFDTPLPETEPLGRTVVITAEGPPQTDVEVWVELQAPDECEVLSAGDSSDNPITIDAGNWSLDSPDRGATPTNIIIAAIDDGEQELTDADCQALSKVRYQSSGTTNRPGDIITIAADGPYNLAASPAAANVPEGTEQNFTLTLDREIGSTSSDTFVYDLSLTDSDGNGSPDCEFTSGNSQVIFDRSTGSSQVLRVRVIDDGDDGNEAGESCTVTLDFNAADSRNNEALPLTRDVVITIEDDPINAADATLRLSATETTTTTTSQLFSETFAFNSSTTINGSTANRLEEGFAGSDLEEYVELSFAVVEEAITPGINIELVITDGPGRCDLNFGPLPDAGSLDNTNEGTLTLTGNDTLLVQFYPADNTFLSNDFSCELRATVTSPNRTPAQVLTFTLDANDTNDDSFEIYTRPDVEQSPLPTVAENSSREFCFRLTTAPSSTTSVRIGADDTYCSFSPSTLTFRPGDGDNAEQCGTVTTTNIPDGTVEELCEISTSLNNPPQNYIDAGAFTGDPDDSVPEIRLVIPNDNPPIDDDDDDDDDDDSLSTEEADTIADPTAIPEATELPAVTEEAGPTAVPTFPPAPSVQLVEGVRVLPVRTGPYLGATFVTIAVDESPAGEPQRYRVLARNNDETADITWYQIVANGKIGWASGRSLELINVTNEQLPVIGSVFDEIEGVPDLGAFGTLVRERPIYRRPSTRAATTGVVIPEGSVVSIIGRTREFPYDDWYQVRWAGQTGWILSETRLEEPAIIVNPDVVREAVPVR